MHLVKNKIKEKQKGFSLIEMLVVIAIFGILTAIVVSGYSKFTNDTILTNMAYEMALSIREAQIYGIAVSNRSDVDSFENKFGINFYLKGGLDDTQVYHLFEDADGSNTYDGNGSCSGSTDICQQEYGLQRNILIDEVFVNCSTVLADDELDIVFDRPNPEPIINGARDRSAQIRLESPEGTRRFVIINSNGQIFVDTQMPEC
jgi:prepilin-type N-terminal cleavage/methylation domain-containing protein